jgi:hypothetical protein
VSSNQAAHRSGGLLSDDALKREREWFTADQSVPEELCLGASSINDEEGLECLF